MFATPELAHRIDLAEAGLVSAIVSRVRDTRPQGGAFAEPIAGGWALFAGAGNPVNKVIGIGVDRAPAPADLDRIEAAFAAHGAETRAEVATLARAETHEVLSRRGYVLQGFENVLGCRLDEGAGPPPADAGGPVEVLAVAEGELDTWVRAVAAGFAAPDGSGAGGDQSLPEGDALAAMFDDIYRAGGVRRYLARIGGEVAGGASMRIDGDVALLAGAATLPAFRRRGVQRALLRDRLADAARVGCRLAVVVTQPGSTSQANVQRQGFALLYARAVLVKAAPASLSRTRS